MIVDAQECYSSSQAFTATAASTNFIDHQADRDLSIGEPQALVVVLEVAADGANSDETYSLAWQTDDNSSFSSAATLATITIPRGTAAGTRYVALAAPDTTFERYTRLNFTLGGTTPSVTISAYTVPVKALENYKAYADNILPR